jgi:putative transcription factor
MPANQHVSGQDWAPQAFDFSRQRAAEAQPSTSKVTEAQANRLRQAGGSLSISKKASTNAANPGLGARAKVLDDDHETTRVATVSYDVRLEILRARAAKQWTQAQLAQAINESAAVVTQYENGKAVPNEGVLVRMEKALGVHLRGALAGQPMAPK